MFARGALRPKFEKRRYHTRRGGCKIGSQKGEAARATVSWLRGNSKLRERALSKVSSDQESAGVNEPAYGGSRRASFTYK